MVSSAGYSSMRSALIFLTFTTVKPSLVRALFACFPVPFCPVALMISTRTSCGAAFNSG